MKKRDIIIIAALAVVLVATVLFQTFAIDITASNGTSNEADLAFTFTIAGTDGRSITVPAGETKIFDLFLTNNNNGTIKYLLTYTSTNSLTNVTVAKGSTTVDDVSGTATSNEEKQITLVVANNSSNAVTIDLLPVTGFENGGDLVYDTNTYQQITASYEL